MKDEVNKPISITTIDGQVMKTTTILMAITCRNDNLEALEILLRNGASFNPRSADIL